MQEHGGDKSPHLVVKLDLRWVLVEIIKELLIYTQEDVHANTTVLNAGADNTNQVGDNLHDGHNWYEWSQMKSWTHSEFKKVQKWLLSRVTINSTRHHEIA